MRTSTILRASTLAAALGAALSAHAWIIQINGTINAANAITGTTFEYSDLPALNTTFNYFFLVNGAGAFVAAPPTTFSNGGSSLSIATIPGTNVSHNNNGTFSYSGEWTATNIVNLPILSTGTYSGIFDTPGGNFSLQIAGNSPVPEPASFAVLGVGAFGLLRRRTKRA